MTIRKRGAQRHCDVRVFRCDEQSDNLTKMKVKECATETFKTDAMFLTTLTSMLFHVCHIYSCCSWLLTVTFSLSCIAVGRHPLSFWGVLFVGFVEFISRTESGTPRAGGLKGLRAEVDDIRSELTRLSESVKLTDLGESDPWATASALFGAVSLVQWLLWTARISVLAT